MDRDFVLRDLRLQNVQQRLITASNMERTVTLYLLIGVAAVNQPVHADQRRISRVKSAHVPGGPPLRVFVFVTGDAGSVPGDADLASVPILAKPFTAADLDRVLEHRSTGAQEARS